MSNKNKKLNIDKEVLYNLYIIQKMTSNEIAELFKCTSKTIRNYLSKHNIPIRSNSESVKLERSKWSIEKELNRTKKFICTWNEKSEDEKKEINRRKHLSSKINSPSAIQKAKETKLKNHSYRVSKSEDNFYKNLLLFYKFDDVIRGYIDCRYSFNCDFYIKSKDLFIEYQGHQTHGFEPFDEMNESHMFYLEKMKNRHIDMTTWIKRDVLKLECAKRNNIKLLLIYPKNDSYILKNGELKNIGKFNIININDID